MKTTSCCIVPGSSTYRKIRALAIHCSSKELEKWLKSNNENKILAAANEISVRNVKQALVQRLRLQY